MAALKCKMCGGDLILTEESTVATCEYCGTTQTVPCADNEKKLTLFGRANRLRLGNEFDKAFGVYEAIVADFPEEAEAYWGLMLCKYGIEYVDDPATGKKVPTCHRSSFSSVMEDPNFELVLENADPVARRVYREEAKQIEELRKGIIEVSGKEAPYDVFICYKETDDKGSRTLDSVLAQDVYDALTEKGYRVFFSRITLEDKLGQEYEPYIFAALNSAKVMLAFGTDYEYFNAVWVKNEWSRFLQLMTQDKSKHLIPCFKGIDAYDMPKEFSKLQAQDMGKVGAIQDLLRGIEKLIHVKAPETAPAAAGISQEDMNNALVYSQAMELAEKAKIKNLKKAIKKLKAIPGYRDADSRLLEFQKKLKKKKRTRLIVWLIVLATLGGTVGTAVGKELKEAAEAAEYQRLQQMRKENMQKDLAFLGDDGYGEYARGSSGVSVLRLDKNGELHFSGVEDITDPDDPAAYMPASINMDVTDVYANVMQNEDGSLMKNSAGHVLFFDDAGNTYYITCDKEQEITVHHDQIVTPDYCIAAGVWMKSSKYSGPFWNVLSGRMMINPETDVYISTSTLDEQTQVMMAAEGMFATTFLGGMYIEMPRDGETFGVGEVAHYYDAQKQELRIGSGSDWILVLQFNEMDNSIEVSTIGNCPYDLAGQYF